MSDFIDDPDPVAPAPPPQPDQSSPPEAATDPIQSQPEAATDPFSSPPEAATDPIQSEPGAPSDTTAPLAERRTLSPYSMEPPTSPAQPTSTRPIEQAYTPADATDWVVRPVEPIDPIDSVQAPPSVGPVKPVPPPARTHYYPAPASRLEPPRQRRWPLALLAFGSGLLGALLVGGGLFAAGAFDDPEPPPTTTAVTAPPQTVIVREVIASEGTNGVASAVGRKVVPSIVTVEVGTGDALNSFQAFGSGSGVVFTSDGLILTNHHVIDGALTSRVILQDGRIYDAEIIGSDELTDLAVLKITATDLTPIELGSTVPLQIGDTAIAVGNPLGLNGGASLTVGVVSAFDREVNTGDPTRLFGMLQTDAPITNGSSGGALVDGEGRLIGITTAIGVSESGAEGIGFATPVEVVNRIATQIIATGDVTHAFLGVTLSTSFDIQDDGAAVPSGAVVIGFADDAESAAEVAGLEVNDVILSWNGNPVRTINDLINGIRGSQVGETIQLEVDRNGEIMSFDVVLGERPEGV